MATVFEVAQTIVIGDGVYEDDHHYIVEEMFPELASDFPTLLSVITTPHLINREKTPLLMGPRIKLDRLRWLYYHTKHSQPPTDYEYELGYIMNLQFELSRRREFNAVRLIQRYIDIVEKKLRDMDEPAVPCPDCNQICSYCNVCECECRGNFCSYVSSCLCECCG